MTSTPASSPVPARQPSGPLPRWYLAYCVVIGLIAVTGLSLAVNGIYTNNRQDAENAAANKARDEQTASILQCFNAYTTDTAGTSKEQRPLVVAVTAAQNVVTQAQLRYSEADRKVTLAARERGQALDAVLQFAIDPSRSSDQAMAQRLVMDLIRTQRALINAETDAVPIQGRLSAAFRKSAKANTRLEEFRIKNPVPDPPSTTCAVRD